jgi:DNA processing protein
MTDTISARISGQQPSRPQIIFIPMDNHNDLTAAWLALNSVKGLGPVRVNSLVKHYGSPLALFEKEGHSVLKQWVAFHSSATEVEEPGALLEKAVRQLEEAQRLAITVLTQSDERYPALLREIDAPPPVLFVKGNLDCFSRHCVGVVGTRRPTQYGKNAAAAIVKQLVEKQIVIVSGLAHGIDTISHQTCLDNGGTTIAVLGCGLDRVYPAANKQLAAAILERGAVVSEFECGTLPEAFNFPRRNRVISGLSAGILVVEAPTRSGSLITASYALQQGRDVFAIPGSIFSDQSDGTFNLLKSGAVPVKSGDDIIENIQTIKLSAVAPKVKGYQEQVRHTMPVDLLTEAEKQLYECISSVPQRLDTLAEKAGKKIAELFDVLLNLELKGLIRQVSGQQFVRV